MFISRSSRTFTVSLVLCCVPFLGACKREQQTAEPAAPAEQQVEAPPTPAEQVDAATAEEQKVSRAVATLSPTKGNNVTGTITLQAMDNKVRITGQIQGLSPGQHGFHIHEKGDCTAPDASSAGGHFAPQGSPHGGPDMPPSEKHVGDLGNVTANKKGIADVDVTVEQPLLDPGPMSVIGRAFVVHASADDLKSQPSGDSGARLACAVIEPAPEAGGPEQGEAPAAQ